MAINNSELEKAFHRNITPSIRDTEIPENPDEEIKEKTIFTGRFDLSDPELYNPEREKYKKTTSQKSGYSFVSVYMRAEEKDYLEELAKKYHMSKAAVIRMLIINCK